MSGLKCILLFCEVSSSSCVQSEYYTCFNNSGLTRLIQMFKTTLWVQLSRAEIWFHKLLLSPKCFANVVVVFSSLTTGLISSVALKPDHSIVFALDLKIEASKRKQTALRRNISTAYFQITHQICKPKNRLLNTVPVSKQSFINNVHCLYLQEKIN